jgi:5-methylcytosine-specific restriction endonuclease McrA
MRVVIRPAQPANYPGPDRLTFAGANVALITKFTAPIAPTANTFLITNLLNNVSLAKAMNAPLPVGATQAERNSAATAIENRVSDIYKVAALPLVDGIGSYCSYCGTILPGLAEVEHCVPKAPYPTYAITWTNFLLACSPCNTEKSNEPPRAEAIGWSGGANPTEAQLYYEIRNTHFLWPDIDNNAYSDLPIRLFYLNTATNQWVQLPDAQAANPNNTIVNQNIVTREITANVDMGALGFQIKQVAAVAGSPIGNGDDMIKLCGLNECKTPNSTYDRRVYNRTLAWFTALTAVQHLKSADGTPFFNAALSLFTFACVASGFYQVWTHLIMVNWSAVAAKDFATRVNIQGQYNGSNVAAMFP